MVTLVTALVCFYALLGGSPELRCFIFFALLVFAAALTFPTVEPVYHQWNLFLSPESGLRYWYIPKLALMATLLWLLGRRRPVSIRLMAAFLTCVVGVPRVKH